MAKAHPLDRFIGAERTRAVVIDRRALVRRRAATCLRALIVLAALGLGLGAAPPARAADVAITQPANEQTIHSNPGEVLVRVQATGAAPGSRVRLFVDGAQQSQDQGGGVFVLRGVERGAHVLRAELIDAQGNLVAAAQPVTFYLWHASRLNPHRGR